MRESYAGKKDSMLEKTRLVEYTMTLPVLKLLYFVCVLIQLKKEIELAEEESKRLLGVQKGLKRGIVILHTITAIRNFWTKRPHTALHDCGTCGSKFRVLMTKISRIESAVCVHKFMMHVLCNCRCQASSRL